MRTRQRLIEILPTVNLDVVCADLPPKYLPHCAKMLKNLACSLKDDHDRASSLYMAGKWRWLFNDSAHVQELIDEAIHYLKHPEE